MIEPRLPHGLQVIADAAGVEVALAIAMERGGSRMVIPQKAPGSEIARIVGIDAARKIVKDLANQRIEIPLAKQTLSEWLREKHGWSQERRARQLKVTRRTIQHWDAGTTPSLQTDFFDQAI